MRRFPWTTSRWRDSEADLFCPEPLVGDAESLHVMELHKERITPSSAVQLCY